MINNKKNSLKIFIIKKIINYLKRKQILKPLKRKKIKTYFYIIKILIINYLKKKKKYINKFYKIIINYLWKKKALMKTYLKKKKKKMINFIKKISLKIYIFLDKKFQLLIDHLSFRWENRFSIGIIIYTIIMYLFVYLIYRIWQNHSIDYLILSLT